MKEDFSEELSPRESMRQKEKELLDAAGLNESDTEIIRDLRRYGFSALVHGSLIKSELRDVSDIDFALVGDFSKIPSSMLGKLVPDIKDEYLNSVDYFSIGMVSAAGRRISLHIEKSEFREQYPNNKRPYAREYRPIKNIKASRISRYLLCGFDSEGTPRVFSATCPQEQLAHGVINIIPQTGVFLFEQETAVPESDPGVSFPITHTAYEPEIKNRVMVLGLELDKMRTDRSLYEESDAERLAVLPVERTVAMANEFLGRDSRRHIKESFALLEKYWYTRRTP